MTFHVFTIPFILGVLFLFSVLLYKYVKWFIQLPEADKDMFLSWSTVVRLPAAVWEIVRESLLHFRIWKTNKLLGYMHTSFAFGWFLLILVGWIETTVYFHGEMVPLHLHIFFSYFARPVADMGFSFALVKDVLLGIILFGVCLALFKRFKSRALGMKKTTKHVLGDKIALWALWTIFPARLMAESFTCALVYLEGGEVNRLLGETTIIAPGIGSGSILTNNMGALLANVFPHEFLTYGEVPAWWIYSLALATFFVALPFSRYMHIFTEIPLILLRKAGIKSTETPCSFDNFQIQACSRCGICIDPCQLQRDANINNTQSVYFLRDRRYDKLDASVVDECLMCGRCVQACPVGIDSVKLRLNNRVESAVPCAENRYQYLESVHAETPHGKVGYFAGCMTLLSPRILKAMEEVFRLSGDDVWYADKNGGVCCGRPLKLSGEIEAAQKMMDANKRLFKESGITTLVTSCPICLKVFREDYKLEGIELLHHSQYILRLIQQGKISPKAKNRSFVYHDPCELGRGCNIYDEPRDVIRNFGELREPSETREKALCCGSSIADVHITDDQQRQIAQSLSNTLESTGASAIVTSCPLCKKAIARTANTPVLDLAELLLD